MEDPGGLRDDEEEFLCRMLAEEEERDTVYYHDYCQDKYVYIMSLRIR